MGRPPYLLIPEEAEEAEAMTEVVAGVDMLLAKEGDVEEEQAQPSSRKLLIFRFIFPEKNTDPMPVMGLVILPNLMPLLEGWKMSSRRMSSRRRSLMQRYQSAQPTGHKADR